MGRILGVSEVAHQWYSNAARWSARRSGGGRATSKEGGFCGFVFDSAKKKVTVAVGPRLIPDGVARSTVRNPKHTFAQTTRIVWILDAQHLDVRMQCGSVNNSDRVEFIPDRFSPGCTRTHTFTSYDRFFVFELKTRTRG